MTGKTFKAWAATIHDEAVIEVHWYSWDVLDSDQIRASHITSPPRTSDECNNVEDCTV